MFHFSSSQRDIHIQNLENDTHKMNLLFALLYVSECHTMGPAGIKLCIVNLFEKSASDFYQVDGI
jgi:hypothetical protein